ncbi:MAG: hypothetical protein IJH09_12700 [Clostridia bacterium]|nr:hypothetical protein [Clostridia bacterium]
MSVSDMWKANATTLFLLILLNLALFALGNTPWMALGLLALAGAMFFSYRQGMEFGHSACGILRTVESAQSPDSPAHGQLDDKVVRRAWSVGQGLRGVLAAALVPYAVGCLYIACSLLKIEPLIIPTRLVSWLLATPFWPVVLHWYNTFDRLTGTVAAVLMISPFVLPLCTFAGYMQGPKLWQKSEKAMAEGRRRAKAKSRVNRRKPKPRVQKPEI